MLSKFRSLSKLSLTEAFELCPFLVQIRRTLTYTSHSVTCDPNREHKQNEIVCPEKSCLNCPIFIGGNNTLNSLVKKQTTNDLKSDSNQKRTLTTEGVFKKYLPE